MKFRAEYKYYNKQTKTTGVLTRSFEANGIADAQSQADAAFGTVLPLADLKSASIRPITPREVPAPAAE
jgi:hypothetical protein